MPRHLRLLVHICFLVLIFSTAGSAFSELAPERVLFQRSCSGAELRGRIYGYGYKDYIIGAKENQLMTLHLSSSNVYAYFRIISVNGRADEKLTPSETSEFSGALPESGDYVVRVFMMRAGARKKGAMAAYTLKVSIQ